MKILVKVVILIFITSIISIPLKPPQDRRGRIIHGNQAILGQFPWQVAYFAKNSYSPLAYFCGGSVISEQWILTSAHCFLNADSALVLVGSNVNEGLDNFIETSNFILHPGFKPNNSFVDDIALIKFDEPLVFNDNLQPVALASNYLKAGVKVTVSGWGLTKDNDSISGILNYITLTTITNKKCKKVFGKDAVPASIVCGTFMGDVIEGPCNGDSGGPLVADAFTNPTLVGIFTFRGDNGCESGAPSGYTRVAYYRNWIKNITGI